MQSIEAIRYLRGGCMAQPDRLLWAEAAASAVAEPVLLDGRRHHLRCEGPREWTEFPEQAESAKLEIRFDARVRSSESTPASPDGGRSV